MMTLCMDTSQKYLVLALIKDNEVIASKETICFKQQSETIFPELITLCEEANCSPQDIDQLVVTKGPGSYTGVRIAMTIAKVFCAMKNVPCFTLGSLQLIAGKRDCFAMLDARSHRAYLGQYKDGKCIGNLGVYTIEEIKEIVAGHDVVGDTSLLGMEDSYPNLAAAFLELKDEWEKVENIHCLVPEYLKSQEEYLVK
ncbi:tRNA (adenosine(37)-N6)-threonylcarbamoyltransferase complex dimerization subunit type 1 TsaB [Anaerorhabdus sp.]|uniref:tRNA (adenosine(37)-N6)-threonylcarbamoyltransferase complex dimerization subunit type 1 TsaB n=1 Tax=Anaerorhabdus sp. TaxID=1872524 RepID=UPI002FCCA724